MFGTVFGVHWCKNWYHLTWGSNKNRNSQNAVAVFPGFHFYLFQVVLCFLSKCDSHVNTFFSLLGWLGVVPECACECVWTHVNTLLRMRKTVSICDARRILQKTFKFIPSLWQLHDIEPNDSLPLSTRTFLNYSSRIKHIQTNFQVASGSMEIPQSCWTGWPMGFPIAFSLLFFLFVFAMPCDCIRQLSFDETIFRELPDVICANRLKMRLP